MRDINEASVWDRRRVIAEIQAKIAARTWLYTSEVLYEIRDGIAYQVEEGQVEHYIEAEAKERGFDHIPKGAKSEIIDHIKSSNFMAAEEVEARSPKNLIGFMNGYVDLDQMKKENKITLCHYEVEPSVADPKKLLFFQVIPHNINEIKLEVANTTAAATTPAMLLAAMAPKTYKFFVEIVGEEIVEFQTLKIGYCFYRANPYKVAFFELGKQDSAKTTYISYASVIIGPKNITNESLQSLSNYPFAPIALQHKLLNAYDDLKRDIVKDLGMFKQLTGNSTITVPRKHKEGISFLPYAKLIFLGNFLPKIEPELLDDEAFFSRIKITKYSHQFKRNDSFKDALLKDEEEIEGTIIAALFSLKRFLSDGFDYIGAISDDNMETWKRSIDSVYDFIQTSTADKTLALSKEGTISKDKLYHELYISFMESRQGEAVSKTKFTQTIGKLFGIASAQITPPGSSKRVEGYRGIHEATDQSKGELGRCELCGKSTITVLKDDKRVCYGGC